MKHRIALVEDWGDHLPMVWRNDRWRQEEYLQGFQVLLDSSPLWHGLVRLVGIKYGQSFVLSSVAFKGRFH